MNQLYMNHQNIAPLIHALEDIVTAAHQEQEKKCDKFQLRQAIYEHFSDTLYAMNAYKNNIRDGHGDEVKLEQDILPNKNDTYQIEGSFFNDLTQEKKVESNKVKTRSQREEEVQLALAEWMNCEEKQIFDKKEINQKYTELWGGKKKSLSTDQLRIIVENYNLKNVFLHDKEGVHPLWNDMNHSVTQVKREEAELSKEMSSLNFTIKENEEDEQVRIQ